MLRLTLGILLLLPATPLAAPVHTSYLWHMHQPIYWPERSTWNGTAYEFAYETLTLGSAQNDVHAIFNKDDRVRDYQDYPKLAIQSVLGHPDAGAQVSFAGSLIQNLNSLAVAGWNGGRYPTNWWQPYRDAHSWTTSGGRTRMDPVIVAFHHSINPLVDEAVFRKMIQAQKAIMPGTWGNATPSTGFFPAEMCFSERLIPVLESEGIDWSIVADVHIARACADYPWVAHEDNCDPPNPADQINPAQGSYTAQSISRGVTVKVPAPYALRPHYAEYVDAATGAVSRIVVVPAANAMSWNEGYGLYGTGEIDAIASQNDPANPMLILFAHDGDNAWQGGSSYYNENVSQFTNAAAAQGYEPTTIGEYLADHPPAPSDVVHVEDGGWVNADGDFGSPQFINWNWPLVNASGQFDIPGGWAEDERNWAVLTAAVNHVLTAEAVAGAPDANRVVDPQLPGSTDIDTAWHFLLAGHESGYMYYGSALDMEVKPTLAANRAVEHALAAIGTGADTTPPTIWIPQRLPWNPGGRGGGSLWGYPGENGAAMTRDFHVWTFVHDVSGLSTVALKVREDLDGANDPASHDNELYAGGPEVAAWTTLPMNVRAFPAGNVHNNPEIDFFVMPTAIADQYWLELTGYEDVLLDYYVEATDIHGNVRRSPIQHVYVGTGDAGGGPGAAVTWTPETPSAGGTLTVTYDPVAGTLDDATSPVWIHVGHSGWTGVLSPDPPMTWDPVDAVWTYTYAVPTSATSVQFVFTDGAGAWDNNGGADWHVSVAGSAPPPYLMDGTLDTGPAVVGACANGTLYAEYDGTWLYVATPLGTLGGVDRFLFVADAATAGTRAAPWGKSGTVGTFDRFIGNEESNGWAGWFDDTETVTTSGVSVAAGAVLEGMIDVAAVWGTPPSTLRLALGTYGSEDGGALANQVACGNADGNLDVAEWITLSLAVADAPSWVPRTPVQVTLANPVRGRLTASVRAPTGILDAWVLDVRGRRVARLEPRGTGSDFTLNWNPSRQVASGIYFLSIHTQEHRATRRFVLLQ